MTMPGVNGVTELSFNLKKEYDRLLKELAELKKENALLSAELGRKGSGFCGRIISFVESLFMNNSYSDFLFRTPNAVVPGHKFVLQARGGSWQFLNEGDIEYIDLTGCDQKICETFILWLYTGVLQNRDDQILIRLLDLSVSFGLQSLFSQCELELLPLIGRENCVPVYCAAYSLKSTKLLECSFSILTSLWHDISREEISGFSSTALRCFLEKHSRYPIHSAILLERTDTVLLLLEANPIETRSLVNQLNEDGLSPLYLALKTRHFELAEKLLHFGANLDLPIGPKDKQLVTTQFAFVSGAYETVQFLILHGSQPNLCDPQRSRTLLHQIAVTGFNNGETITPIDLAKLLINCGADLSFEDRDGNTPLHLSILYDNPEMFDLLMAHVEQLQLEKSNNQGFCPLWLALLGQFPSPHHLNLQIYGFARSSYNPNTEYHNYATQLVRAGANVNYRFQKIKLLGEIDSVSDKLPQSGDTLLLACTRIAHETAALFLLDEPLCDKYAECSSCNEGETVLYLAVESKLSSLAERLALHSDIIPDKMWRSRVPVTLCNDPANHNTPTKCQKSLNPFDLDETSMESENATGNPFTNEITVNMPKGKLNHVNHAAVCCKHLYQNPLHLAVRNSMFHIIEIYLNRTDMRYAIDWLLLDHECESVISLLLWYSKFDLARELLNLCQNTANLENSPYFESHLKDHMSLPILLFEAIKRNQLDVVKFLVGQGFDVNQSSRYELPLMNKSKSSVDQPTCICPLWTALICGNTEIADYLVSCKSNLDMWSQLNDTNIEVTLLHRAIYGHYEDAAIFLVKNNCDINATTRLVNPSIPLKKSNQSSFLVPYLMKSPLHMAVSEGMFNLTKTLIKANCASINQQDFDGMTPLHLAIQSGHETIVNLLLTVPNIDCSIRDAQGHTAFHLAMMLRQRSVAHSLLKKDSDLSLQTNNSGRNFLHSAIENGDREAIFFLIQIGFDMNESTHDVHRLAPLHLAIKVGVAEDILRSLLLAGASIHAKTPQKQSALHLAVIHDRPALIHCLLENGANVNAVDSERNTPLHLTVRHARVECLVQLLNHADTNPHCVNMRGQLPVHLLANHNTPVAIEMLQLILEVCGADQINAQDAAGNTPLILAYQAQNVRLCIDLLQAGAQFGLTNAEGDNVFTLNRKKHQSATPGRILSQLLDSIMQEPKWEDGIQCVECGSKFGLTNRKHHCRHCGRLLCTQCSLHEMPIIKFGLNKPVRICETCFNFLQNPLGSF